MPKFKSTIISFSSAFLVLAGLVLVSYTVHAQGGRIPPGLSNEPVCPGPVSKGNARCHARVVVGPDRKPNVATQPSGYGPAQFHGAYNLPNVASSGNPTIAVVDAYDHPNIASDLKTYSSTFGIPSLPNCTGPIAASTVPCFQKIDQNGGTAYPATNANWALEIALDVETAHAICQNCKILLVEANSSSYANLMTAFDQAVAQGATIISNSYGSSEFSSESSYDYHFNHPGVAITFSSGDSGYGAQYPAASKYVVAVGGTTLNLGAGNTYGSESVWNGTGSGCSVYETEKPTGQPVLAGCTGRIIADISADADPSTGAAVYDSVRLQGRKGWFQVGGTSLSSPLVAGVYALVGGVSSGVFANSLLYSALPANFHDVVTGATTGCDGTALCSATPGYDGPTGLGSPNGTSGF